MIATPRRRRLAYRHFDGFERASRWQVDSFRTFHPDLNVELVPFEISRSLTAHGHRRRMSRRRLVPPPRRLRLAARADRCRLPAPARPVPRGAARESRSFVLEEFDDRVVTVLAVHHNWSSHPHASVRRTGTNGQSEGTRGDLHDHPLDGPDPSTYWSGTTAPWHTVTRGLTQRWIPEVFVGPMANLQGAVTEGREPVTLAREDLRTLRCVDAAHRSADLGRRAYLDEVNA